MSIRFSRLSVALALLAPAVAAAPGDVVLTGGHVPGTPQLGEAQAITPVDLDGDGLLDLVQSKWRVHLFRQLPGGRFTPGASLEREGLAVAADLDGDGQLSIIVVGKDEVGASEFVAPFVPGSDALLAGPGDGTGSLFPFFAATADLNGDGHADVLADRDGALRTWLGDGAGGLQPSVPAGGSVGSWTELGDLDLDGQLDLLGGTAGSASLKLLLGQGDGIFLEQATIPLTASAQDVALGHLDGDGLLDVAVATSAGVELLHGTGGGGFAAWMTAVESGAAGAQDVDLGDADGDGDDDVVSKRNGINTAIVRLVDAAGIAATGGFVANGTDLAFMALDGGKMGVVLSSGTGSASSVTVVECGADGLPELETVLATNLYPLALADVDGDGVKEFVMWRAGTQKVVVHEIPGDGTLGPPGPLSGMAVAVNSARVIDLDGDEREDLLLQDTNNFTAEWRPWRSNGSGLFFPGPTIVNQGGVNASAPLGDLDGDGDVDLLVVSPSQSAWYPNLLNGGFGPASPATIPDLSSKYDLVLADIDEDGQPDLLQGQSIVQAPPEGSHLRSWKGLGSGSFAGPQTLSINPCGTNRVLAEDLDSDGHLDLVAAGESNGVSNNVGVVTVLRGHGDGSFDAATHHPMGVQYSDASIGSADFDGDGRRDIVLHDVLLPQSADGLFGEARRLPLTSMTKSHYQEFFATDMNSDAVPDIVAMGPSSPSFLGGLLRVALVHLEPHVLDLGHAKAGAAGEPVLTGSGTMQRGESAKLRLEAAPAGAPMLLVLGLQTLGLPFGGGVLVPQPDAVVGGFTADASGHLALESRWPADAPPGLVVYVQFWGQDPYSNQLAASNALQLEGE